METKDCWLAQRTLVGQGLDSRGLRAALTDLLDELDSGSGIELIETGADDAMPVEVDRPTLVGADATEILGWIDLGYPTGRGSVMTLDVVPMLALVVLQLSTRGTECVAQRNVDIFMRVLSTMFPVDRDGVARHRDVYVYLV
jgi:hypothetical protein